MNPIPFSWMLVAILLSSVLGASAAWHVANWRYGMEKERSVVAALEAQKKAEDRAQEISDKFVKRLDNLKIVNTTINTKVQHELETRVYSDCKLPESGRLLLNDGIDATNDALGFTRTMPAAPSPRIEGRPVPSNDGGSAAARSRYDAALRDLRGQAKGSSGKHDAAKEVKK